MGRGELGGARRGGVVRSALGATLTGEIATRQGEELALELVTGQRPTAIVEWLSGGEAGVRFKQPIDVLALIKRTLISQPAERRSMPRVELRCGARLKWGATVCDATPAEHFGARDAAGSRWPAAKGYICQFRLTGSTFRRARLCGGRTISPASS